MSFKGSVFVCVKKIRAENLSQGEKSDALVAGVDTESKQTTLYCCP